MTSSIERHSFNRRMLIKAASASTFALAAPRLSWGQSKTLVAATFRERGVRPIARSSFRLSRRRRARR